MMEENMAANAEIVAESQTDTESTEEVLENDTLSDESIDAEQTGSEASDDDTQTNKPESTEPKKDVSETQAFAHRLKEETTKAKDAVIAEMYGKSHGIYTYEQYQEAVEQAERQKQIEELGDIPEDVAKEIVEARELKAKIALEEKQKKNFQEFVETFPNVDATKIPTEVWEMVSKGKDLTSAYALYQVKNMDKVKVEAEQETLKKIKQNAETSTGSIQSNTQDNDTMTVDQVNKLLEGMGSNERSNWIDKNIDNLEKWGYFKHF